MNEETMYRGTGACLLQNVYSINYNPKTGNKQREKKHLVTGFVKRYTSHKSLHLCGRHL